MSNIAASSSQENNGSGGGQNSSGGPGHNFPSQMVSFTVYDTSAQYVGNRIAAQVFTISAVHDPSNNDHPDLDNDNTQSVPPELRITCFLGDNPDTQDDEAFRLSQLARADDAMRTQLSTQRSLFSLLTSMVDEASNVEPQGNTADEAWNVELQASADDETSQLADSVPPTPRQFSNPSVSDSFETFADSDTEDDNHFFEGPQGQLVFRPTLGQWGAGGPLLANSDEALMAVHSVNEEPKLQPASKESIENLEVVKIEGLSSVCPVCLEEFSIGSEAKRMPCSHIYHENCITEWLMISNTCPICRHQMPTA